MRHREEGGEGGKGVARGSSLMSRFECMSFLKLKRFTRFALVTPLFVSPTPSISLISFSSLFSAPLSTTHSSPESGFSRLSVRYHTLHICQWFPFFSIFT